VKRVGILVGPKDRLKNIRLNQVAYADHYSQSFADEPSDKNLNGFFGALYRPFFLPFKKQLLPFFQWIARLVPRRTKEAALMNYRGMIRAAKQVYPSVYKPPLNGQKSKMERLGWTGTVRSLADTGLHGSEEQCWNLTYPNAMITFEYNNIKAEEAEKRMEEAREKAQKR
jgi:hypothetical protein